jgi:hypothetical protein
MMRSRCARIASAVGVMIATMILLSAHTAAANAATAERLSGKHTTQSKNGLTCRNSWYTTYGGTSCTGNSAQKWRLRVACQVQSDHKGPLNYGAGSDGFECNVGVSKASVEWVDI